LQKQVLPPGKGQPVTASSTRYDLLLRNGTVFDGEGGPGRAVDVGVRDGRIAALAPRLEATSAEEIDVGGQWVMPGMLDIHTHYDLELEKYPELKESVRHGVTTVVVGNCSLSIALGGGIEETLDLFCRVENMPRPILQDWLSGALTWLDVRGYLDHLRQLPIGPNVAAFLGHSSLRAHVMGLERSLFEARPNSSELAQMKEIVADATDAGYLGLSIDMLPWHRLDGEKFGGASVPSQRARLREYRALASVLRKKNGILQATPNAALPPTVLALAAMSAGLFRRALKTTVVAALDVKRSRLLHRAATAVARFANLFLRGDFRFQVLAGEFLLYGDGPVTPLFEEFATGVRLMDSSPSERSALLSDPSFRAEFRRQWTRRGTMFHKNLAEMWIVSAPDQTMIGKSFAQVAGERGRDPIDLYLDLIAAHDTGVRWKSVVANHRPAIRRRLMQHPDTLPGFNDSGAHNRNQAMYDGGLEMLQQAALHPRSFPVEKAIARLTRRTAEWLGLDTGRIAVGDVADVCVIDPARLVTHSFEPIEETSPDYGGLRMVKRTDGVVSMVCIGGRVAFRGGHFADDLGSRAFGRVLQKNPRS